MKKVKFKVMSYNVQCYDYINNQLVPQKRIIDKNNVPVIAFQELSTSRRIKPVGEAALADYPYKYFSAHKAFLGFATKTPLTNLRAKDFRGQDPQDMIQYGQTRAYHMADYVVGGKTVTLINTHLCFLTQEIKFMQMRELLEVAQKQNHTIITGDFNCFMTEKNDFEYVNMYKPFVDAGYHLANCEAGIKKTWTDKGYPKKLSEFTYPTDNIIVSPDITIKKVYYDTTKLSYPNGYAMDHIPLIALVCVE